MSVSLIPTSLPDADGSRPLPGKHHHVLVSFVIYFLKKLAEVLAGLKGIDGGSDAG
jgi:hypothetical protein